MQVKLSSLTTWQKVQLLRRELSRECLEREYHIDALIALMICKQHGLLLGPPGTAKSMLVELLCKAFSGKYFSLLVSDNTKPDEFFGPISISSLKSAKEVYKRNTTGRLPEAEIAYLDEIFKANSASLNQLLKLINERVYENPDPAKVPLRSLIGSSNELPDDAGPFVDRFTWKHWVGYLKERDSTIALWKRTLNKHAAKINVRLSLTDLDDALKLADSVDMHSQLPLLYTLKTKLGEAGFEISDRRWLSILRFMQTFAWVRNEPVVSTDIIKLLLPDCLWQRPEDHPIITYKINEIIESLSTQLNDIKQSIESINGSFKSSNRLSSDTWNLNAIELIAKLDEHLNIVDKLEAEGAPADLLTEVKLGVQQSISTIQSAIETANESREDRRRREAEKTIEAITHQAQIVVSRWRNSFNSVSLDEWNDESTRIGALIRSDINSIQNTSYADPSLIEKAVKELKAHIPSIRQEVSYRNNVELPAK